MCNPNTNWPRCNWFHYVFNSLRQNPDGCVSHVLQLMGSECLSTGINKLVYTRTENQQGPLQNSGCRLGDQQSHSLYPFLFVCSSAGILNTYRGRQEIKARRGTKGKEQTRDMLVVWFAAQATSHYLHSSEDEVIGTETIPRR